MRNIAKFSNEDDHSEDDVHATSDNANLNSLRAAVLGANDGIVSVASIVLGVAGATNDRGAIVTAGLAGLVAGALSMAVGEYVSVSTQRDTQKASIDHERWELKTKPEEELAELTQLYEAKGVSRKTAQLVAKELTEADVLNAHLDVELKIDPENLNNPWQAGIASLLSFTLGALIPLLSVALAARQLRFTVTFIAVLIALVVTGYLSAIVGGASRYRAIARVIIGGALAMVITYAIGSLFGASTK